MKELLNKILVHATHQVTNIILQTMLLPILIWYYDMSIKWYVLSSAACLALLIADHVITKMILQKACGKLQFTWWQQLLDFVFAVPSVLIVAAEIVQIIVTRHIGTPKINIIAGIVLVLIINYLLIVERLVLIRKS